MSDQSEQPVGRALSRRWEHQAHLLLQKDLPRLKAHFDRQVAEGLLTEQQAAEWFERCKAAIPAPASPEELALFAFADRLKHRQASHPPDFDAIYRRKAELDGTES